MRALGPRSWAAGLKRVFDVLYALMFVAVMLTVLLAAIILLAGGFESLTALALVELHFEPEIYDVAPTDGTNRRYEFLETVGELEVEGVGRGPFLLGLVWAMVDAFLVLFILHQLRAIFATLRDADPFVPENAERVRNIGLSILAAELVTHGYFAWSYFLFVAGRFSLAGVRMSPHFDPSWVALGAGVALLLVAAVFRLGARMREEQRLTV